MVQKQGFFRGENIFPYIYLHYIGLLEEWDFIRLKPRYSANLSAGPIWCLRASSSGACVAAGCENGKVSSLLYIIIYNALEICQFLLSDFGVEYLVNNGLFTC